ncbi:MAG TPA: tetratricopeptide repeat protein [Chitinophagaceae bacterium]|nr:tetratricopeptide repeat protein [Chitinophagaceae bacterium]
MPHHYFCRMKYVSAFIVIAILWSCHSSDTKTTTAQPEKNLQQEMIASLKQQLNAKPDSAGLRLRLITVLDSAGLFKEALQHIDSLTSKDSSNYGLWFTKGLVAEDAGDTLLAEESYLKAINVYRSPDAMLALANLLAEQKDERCLLLAKQVKEMGLGREYDAHAAFVKGVYNARTLNKAKAIQFFNECIANNYTYMEAYIEKGLVYFDNKQFDSALNIFSFAASVNNHYADAIYYQARCYEMMNKKDSAVLKFKQSLTLDKELAEAHEALKRLGAE